MIGLSITRKQDFCTVLCCGHLHSEQGRRQEGPNQAAGKVAACNHGCYTHPAAARLFVLNMNDARITPSKGYQDGDPVQSSGCGGDLSRGLHPQLLSLLPPWPGGHSAC